MMFRVNGEMALRRQLKPLTRFLLMMTFTLAIAAVSLPIALGHHPEEQAIENPAHLKSQALTIVLFCGALIVAITAVALITQKKKINGPTKAVLFSLIMVPALAATFYLASATIYVNHVSATEGPVHWHADFEVWNCGRPLNLVDPDGLGNKIGTTAFHEHNDQRIHVEGVVHDFQDISLPNFFTAVGGKLSPEQLRLPTEDGLATINRGDLCQGSPGEVQAFVYYTENEEVLQRKLSDFNNYQIAPYSSVPPGDCIIVEFSPPVEKTEHLCESYRLAETNGDGHGR